MCSHLPPPPKVKLVVQLFTYSFSDFSFIITEVHLVKGKK
jgi:hypothetical protein